MKLRAFAVFAIATLLPSSATAQQSRLCVKVGASDVGSSPDALAISQSIAAILVENLPEAWSCEYNGDVDFWHLYGVTVALVDHPDRGRRYFDTYLSAGVWFRFSTEPQTPQVIVVLSDYTSVRDVAEEFELRIRQTIREARWGVGEPQR